MNKFEVLLVTMGRKDTRFLEEMKVNTNIVIANQNNTVDKESFCVNGKYTKFISSDTVGVGINRNISLLFSEAEICLLADDDEIFRDGYENIILSAFEENSKADILIFNVNMLKDNTSNRINKKIKKVNSLNYSNYGAVRIAFRREKVMRKNIWFSTKFGGGAEFSSGEDSLFLKEALNKGLKIYTAPYCIADVREEESTWFRGYNKKYFYDKGAYLKIASPKLKYIYSLYFAIKFSKRSNLKFLDILKLINKGIKEF